MSPKKVQHFDGQEAFPVDGLAPSIPLPYVVDFSNEGVSTPLIEGWTVMNKAINDVARARSNQGFAKLPVNSRPVQEFANRIDESPDEAQRLVAAAGDARHKGGPNLTHYDKAQMRLFDYHKKQAERAKTDPRMLAIGDIALVTESLPISVGEVEHKFFYANTPEDYRKNEQRRRGIAKFVKKHSL